MSKIVSIRKVANGNLQAEMVDTIEKPGAVNVLAKLNKGDDRFNVGSQRRAWFPVTLASLSDLGLSDIQLQKIHNLQQDERFAVEINDPMIDGYKLRIQVNESIFPDMWQRQNAAKAAKQLMIDERVAANTKLNSEYDLSKYVGQNGYFLDEHGNHIFSRTTVTIEPQVKHTIIQATLVPESELGTFGATLAQPTTVEVEAEEVTA
jgi:hypothetical protein